ncbi:MAG: M50 family metallopeptidase [Oscillochloris sp.]|nr:M50 family metallopeptidase [Oscillochloris sp.]
MSISPDTNLPIAGRSVAPASLALLGAIAAMIVGWLGPLAYPFRLLTTLVHELGHGLAALITGGSFRNFVVFADGSGLAYTAGGWRWLIIPAGYLSVALLATVLISLGRNPRAGRVALLILGAALALLSLRFALPTIFSTALVSGLLTLVAGIGIGGAILFVALRAGLGWTVFLLNLLAFRLGLSAFGDLWMLFGVTTTIGLGNRSDANAMAELTFIPAPIWAILWALLALVMLGGALWRTWLRRS